MNEKIIEIRKATQKQTVAAIKSGDFSEFFRDLPRSVDVNFLEQ